ncbi:CPBP family intramembrane metalloprotease [Bradyrhizobium rifense]|uniref:CPBP family intramembrane metalloprotease n=2 Tax=Bradyrhizobium rifense TaxID=515499 RepID=A0A5D3KGZ5_9BRAD|nr:CPBP family intramembrane metalloprotease [Bradyrhizobium rifense]
MVLNFILAATVGAKAYAPGEFKTWASQGRWYGVYLVSGAPAAVAVLWVAIRMAGRDFGEYLALNWPTGGEIVRALAITTIFMSIEGVVLSKMSTGGYQSDPTLIVGSAGGLLVWLIGGSIAGPLMEEFVVRGFLFRGWSESFLGPVGAIILTSAVWALNHTQYDWFGRSIIFAFGLVLGHLRWSSNSTWTTVVAHSACNILISVTLGRYV